MTGRDNLRLDMLDYYGVDRFPEPVPLNMRVLWKRTFLEYEEWKIEYDVETPDTMPAEAGRSVPAYLLIPRRKSENPLPAAMSFHQCAIDCAIGKEVVVGKAPWSPGSATMAEVLRPAERVSYDRTDQAYGHDLVHNGFVVLAPDSINCGERNIEQIRLKGQNRVCFDMIDDQLGRPHMIKHLFDNMRSVDLLQSLEFVDPNRIAAVGHSMGAGDVFDLMVVDPRVKAGILSGDGPADEPPAKFIPLISPRLYIGIRGLYDGPPERLQAVHDMHAAAKPAYAEDGAPSNLVLLTAPMGHRFSEPLKWKAYKRLKEHFGTIPPRETVTLESIVMKARENSRWFWLDDEQGDFADPRVESDCRVAVNLDEMVAALTGLFFDLFTTAATVRLQSTIREESGNCILDLCIPGDHDYGGGSPVADFAMQRDLQRALIEHNANLHHHRKGKELHFSIAFPAENLKSITSDRADRTDADPNTPAVSRCQSGPSKDGALIRAAHRHVMCAESLEGEGHL